MNRRNLLKGLTGAVVAAPVAVLSDVAAAQGKPLQTAQLRGSLDASKFGVLPDTHDDQSQLLQTVLEKAASEDKPVYLPPGTYVVSNINLPSRTRVLGVSGTSRIIYGGGGAMLSGSDCELVEMSGIVLDGANRAMGDPFGGLLNARACPRVLIDNCDFVGSSGCGISLDLCGGRVERSRLSGALGVAALYSVNATGLAIQNNEVFDCANGGILVHRWKQGEDATILSGNRIRRIAAAGGGTGQRGNGINLFRADAVIVSNNHITDCAFSAIRANSASNAQITGNTCLRSGETAVYAEFSFEGSVIANNIVDGGTIGISIANFDQGGRLAVCANNLVRNLRLDGPYPAEYAGFGIGIYSEAETSLTGNVIEGAPRYGMMLGWGSYLRNVVASNNIVRDAATGIAVSVVTGAGKTSISGNVISETPRGAVVGHEWAKAVTGDLAGSKRAAFPHLTVERNVVS